VVGCKECLQTELLLYHVGHKTLTWWIGCHCCDAGQQTSSVTGATCMRLSMRCGAELHTQVMAPKAIHNSRTELWLEPAVAFYSVAVYISTLAISKRPLLLFSVS